MVPFFCLKGFIREPEPTKKGIRVLPGILGKLQRRHFWGGFGPLDFRGQGGFWRLKTLPSLFHPKTL